MKRLLISATAAFAMLACASDPKVVRVYDGKVVEGHYVTPDGYAAYLRAVLAEENGDLKGAMSHLEQAVAEDDDDPEVWARVGEVRCKLAPTDKAADDAFARALKLDPTYAGALAAKARCALARGKTDEAFDLAKRANAADPTNVGLEALLVRADARRPNAALRERAVALTAAHGEHVAAWDALVAWARARHDPELLARGLEGLLHVAPMRSNEVEKGALELAGDGQVALARRVAAAITDAPPQFLVRGPHDPAVGRLAVDEALVRGDKAAAVRRATKAHVDLGESAARAWLWGRHDLAGALATEVRGADPSAVGPRIVLAVIDGAPLPRDATGAGPAGRLLLAERLLAAGDAEAAKAALRARADAPFDADDPLVGPRAVDLAARGVVAEAMLAPGLRVELAARRRATPPPLEASTALAARHALLHRALTAPLGADTRSLAARLVPAADRDPVVAFALLRMAFASDASGVVERLRTASALAQPSSDALTLSAAVEIAMKRGREGEVGPARTRLMAVARTPAERALAVGHD